jgi:hypothetical protein
MAVKNLACIRLRNLRNLAAGRDRTGDNIATSLTIKHR